MISNDGGERRDERQRQRQIDIERVREGESKGGEKRNETVRNGVWIRAPKGMEDWEKKEEEKEEEKLYWG